MKKVIVGILLGVTILCQPITAHAQCEMFSRTHDVQMNVNEFTYEEAQLLMQIASAEALNQGEDGMNCVMSVVINRVNDPDYPDTIKEVIFQEHQFYVAGMKNAIITPEVHMALASLEAGNCVPQIIAFERTGNNDLDVYFTKAFVMKDHVFYTKKID